MFDAVRTPAAAAFGLLLLLGPAQTGAAFAGKRPDFGTTRDSRSTTAITAVQSVSSTIANVPVCAAIYDQNAPVLIPDGGGGVIVVWSDFRSGNLDIFAQKLNGGGVPQWPGDGVPVCKASGHQTKPRAVSDQAGGVIVVWQDDRSGNDDIYAQRVNVLGAPVWTSGGILVSGATNAQRDPVASPNGLGGVIISWVDERGGNADIYAQRLSATGVPYWAANGIAVCAAAGIQETISAVTDGQGGAILAWRDNRSDAGDVYAQRLSEAGVSHWAVNGVVLCSATGAQQTPQAIADGAGGAIVTWADGRAGNLDVYVQRVSGAGSSLWSANGVALCAATGDQQLPRISSDGSGGAVVAWEDRRGAAADIFAGRVSDSGVPQWLGDGVVVCSAPEEQTAPTIVVDPAGGTLVAWTDGRTPANFGDIYVQHLLNDGSSLWAADGVLVCNAADQQDAVAVVSDTQGGANVVWRDRRSGQYTDLYSQGVSASGEVPNQCTPPDTLASKVGVLTVAVQNYRTFRQNDFYWAGVGVRGDSGDWDIEVYDQGGAFLNPYPTCFGLPLAGSYVSSGVDFVMGNFNDLHTPPGTYGARAWRYGGIGGATIEWDAGRDQIFLASAANPAPGVGETNWTGPLDVIDVGLTAGNTYVFELNKTNPLADVKLLLFTSAGSSDYYYVVPRNSRVMESSGRYTVYQAVSSEYYGIAVVNDNGLPTDYILKVWSDTPVGVGDGPGSSVTGIRGLSPNPAKGAVQIQFAMRDAGEVAFQIHDMAGRVVAAIPGQRWQPGTWSVTWDGRSDGGRNLSAGMYFVQMKVDGRNIGVGRMAIVR